MANLNELKENYLKKLAQVKSSLPDFENKPLIEILARMNLTEDEIWWLSVLEIITEDESLSWEGFERLKKKMQDQLTKERFESNKNKIESKRIELGLTQ